MNLTYPLYDCIFFDFPFLIHSQRIVVNGHYIIYETEDVTRSGMYVFNYFVVSLSKFFSWSVRHFFVYLRPPFFVVFHQHPLMVRGTSSSSSNRSRSRSHSKHTSCARLRLPNQPVCQAYLGQRKELLATASIYALRWSWRTMRHCIVPSA